MAEFLKLIGITVAMYLVAVALLWFVILPRLERAHQRRMDRINEEADRRWLEERSRWRP